MAPNNKKAKDGMYNFLKNKTRTIAENNESSAIENIKEFSNFNIFNNTTIAPTKLTIEIDFKIIFSNI